MASESLEKAQEERIKNEEFDNNTWEWYKKAKTEKLGFYWNNYDSKVEPEEIIDYVEDNKISEEDKLKELHDSLSDMSDTWLEWYNSTQENDWIISWEEMHDYIETNNLNKGKTIDHNELPDMSSTWKEEEHIENIKELENKKIDENPKTPLIDWLVWQKLLTIEEWEIIKNAIVEEWDIFEQIEKIDWISDDKKGQIFDSINYLEWEEWKEKCRNKFNNDLKEEIDWIKEDVVGWKSWEKKLTHTKERLLDKLGWNYYSLWNPEGWMETNKESLDKAFKITLNEFINNEQFKEPENFKNIKWTILNWNIDFKTRFEQLQIIEKQITNSTSSINNKQSKAFEKRQDKKINDFKTNEAFAEFIADYIKKKTNEAEQLNQKLADITDKLFDEPKKVISEDKKLEIFSEVNEILWE